MSHTAYEVPEKTIREALNVAVSFSGKLAVGEKLTGTPTLEENVTSDLTFSSIGISTTVLNISGVDVPIGEAVIFHLVGGVADVSYSVNVFSDTDSTPAQTLFGEITFNVEDD